LSDFTVVMVRKAWGTEVSLLQGDSTDGVLVDGAVLDINVKVSDAAARFGFNEVRSHFADNVVVVEVTPMGVPA